MVGSRVVGVVAVGEGVWEWVCVIGMAGLRLGGADVGENAEGLCA